MIHVKVSQRSLGRVLCFDLENRPLAYWYDGQTTSEITAFGWKWSDESDVHTMLLRPNGRFVLDDGRQSFAAAEAYIHFAAELASAGLVFGHNIRRHDLPMLNAGLVRRQLPPLAPVLTSDTCRDIPKLGGMSKSLENLAGYYALDGVKYTMSQPMWEDANRLTDGGIALARKRVSSDVLLQEALRAKLLDLAILKAPRTWAP
jgi:hypothetical protein